jgi:hypothetical protein
MNVGDNSPLRKIPVKWELVTFYNVAFVGLILLAGATALTWITQATVAAEPAETGE